MSYFISSPNEDGETTLDAMIMDGWVINIIIIYFLVFYCNEH